MTINGAEGDSSVAATPFEPRRERPAETAPVAVAEAAPAPVPVEPVVRVSAPESVAPVVERAPEPRVEQTPVPVRETPPVAPKVDVREALSSSGLVMVETTSKTSVAPVEPEPAVPLGRPRPVRPRAAPADEPLVQVETRDK